MGATIKDIAEKTGLGLATISKYLNGGHVLEKNQAAIEAAIDELDFQVNGFARSLKTHHSMTVGVVIPQLDNLFMTSIITSLEETLRAKGYGVLVCDTSRMESRESEVLNFLQQKMVDGLIFLATGREAESLNAVLNRRIPVVLIDRKIERFSDTLDMVLLDNYQAAFDSTMYLIRRGHRHIGILAGSPEVYTASERLRGYCAALKEEGIPIEEELIRFTGFTTEGSYRETLSMFSRGEGPTAIFATNFEMTLGALLALKDLGRNVPEDVSLIGFDNLQLARAMQPALTIVSQPVREMGVRAAALLLSRMQPSDTKRPPETVMMRARIVEGASVSQPPLRAMR